MTKKIIKEDVSEEFKATGANASVPDPVTTGNPHANRSADKSEGEKENPLAKLSKYEILASIMQAAQKMNKENLASIHSKMNEMVEGLENVSSNEIIKEDIKSLFGEDLDEEFVTKATTIFEAAVITKLESEVARLEESFETKLTEATDTFVSEMTEKVDAYISYIADEWLEQNAVEVKAGLRADMSESFLAGLKSLFEEHYVEIPEEKEEIVEALTLKVDELEAKLNEEINSKIEMKKIVEEMEANQIFDELSEGLAETQKEKFRTLAENIEYADNEEFKSKLETLKETYFTKSSDKKVEADQLISDEVETIVEHVDPRVSRYVDALSRTVKR